MEVYITIFERENEDPKYCPLYSFTAEHQESTAAYVEKQGLKVAYKSKSVHIDQIDMLKVSTLLEKLLTKAEMIGDINQQEFDEELETLLH